MPCLPPLFIFKIVPFNKVVKSPKCKIVTMHARFANLKWKFVVKSFIFDVSYRVYGNNFCKSKLKNLLKNNGSFNEKIVKCWIGTMYFCKFYFLILGSKNVDPVALLLGNFAKFDSYQRTKRRCMFPKLNFWNERVLKANKKHKKRAFFIVLFYSCS